MQQTSSLRKLRNALCTLQKKPQIVFAVRRSDTKKQRERTLRGKSCGNKLCSVPRELLVYSQLSLKLRMCDFQVKLFNRIRSQRPEQRNDAQPAIGFL